MPEQPIAISDITDPAQIRVKLLASGKDVHAPMSAVASASIHGAPTKTTPVDADEFGYWDSVGLRAVKTTWAGLKAAILAYFNGTAKATPVAADRVWMGNSAASNVPVYSTWTQIQAALFGTAALKNTGTSGNTVPLLDAANTFSLGAGFSSPGAATGQYVMLNNSVGAGALRVGAGGNTTLYFDDPHSFVIAKGIKSDLASTAFLSGTVLVTVDANGFFAITGSLGRGAPVTKTADFTVAITENWLINNKAAATCTVTLPAAASFLGREINIKNLQAFTVVSASSNVVPLAGGAAATAILSANAGRFCTLVSDGTNWVIMSGVI